CNTTARSRSLLQEDVVRGVRRAMEGAGLIASAGMDAALGVDPLHRRDARQQPEPRCAVTSSLSQGISLAVLPATLATALPTTALPSACSQFGPSQWRPTVLPSSSSVAIGSRNTHASLPSLPALHS